MIKLEIVWKRMNILKTTTFMENAPFVLPISLENKQHGSNWMIFKWVTGFECVLLIRSINIFLPKITKTDWYKTPFNALETTYEKLLQRNCIVWKKYFFLLNARSVENRTCSTATIMFQYFLLMERTRRICFVGKLQLLGNFLVHYFIIKSSKWTMIMKAPEIKLIFHL